MSSSTLNQIMCPATMCPLFAPDGSPWTGDKNSPCPQKPAYREGVPETDTTGCGFWSEARKSCDGVSCAKEQILEVLASGQTFQIGPIQGRDIEIKEGATFDCPKAKECQWQAQSGDKLCPPRLALSKGIDPRFAAF